jgi:hypothetical protein
MLMPQTMSLPYWVESSNLLPVEKEIAVALYGTELRYLTDIQTEIAKLITLTHQSCGQVINAVDVAATIPELCTDLIKYNGILTIEELRIAFKKGYKGEYGEYFGLNNKTYFAWVSAYRYGKDRANAKIAMQKAGESVTTKKEISEEEKEAILREGALNKFNDFKSTRNFYDFGNISYNYLDRLGLITFTAEVKKKIMADCKARMIEEEKMKKTQKDYIGKHQSINDEIKQLEEGKSTRLISEAKREALKQYFSQLIEMGEELKNLI